MSERRSNGVMRCYEKRGGEERDEVQSGGDVWGFVSRFGDMLTMWKSGIGAEGGKSVTAPAAAMRSGIFCEWICGDDEMQMRHSRCRCLRPLDADDDGDSDDDFPKRCKSPDHQSQ